MYTAVLEICKVHESSWSGIPGFANAVNEFELALHTLKQDASKQVSISDGVSMTKFAKLNELFERLMLIHAALAIHARSTGDTDRVIRNTINLSDLKRLSIARLDLHLDNVLEDLGNHGSDLVDLGIDAGLVQETIQLIEEGRMHSVRPRMTIIERRRLTQRLDEGVSKLDDLLHLKIDPLMRLFKFSLPEFFHLYFNARVVIDHKSKKGNASPESGSPPSEDPF